MRKLISFLIISMLVASAFSFNAHAALREKKANVSYGTPVIDGVKDDLYNNSTEIRIEYVTSIANSATEGDPYATGSAWMLWDENALYIYLEVVDTTPVTQPLEGFSSDAFEMVFDFDNINSDINDAYESYYPNGLFVKTLPYARTVGTPEFEIDWVPGMPTPHQEWFIDLPESEHQQAIVITSNGYIIERRIPLNNAVRAMLEPGYTFGMQIWLLDDIDDNSQRDFKIAWGEPVGDVTVEAWGWSAVCDELILIAAPAPPVIEIEEPEPVGGVDAEAVVAAIVAPAPAPQTNDGAILFIIVAFAAAAVIAKKAKKI